MAFNNIEIEIKIQITENDFSNVKEFLKEHKDIIFHGETQQIDTYFAPKDTEGYLGIEKYPYKWLSIRSRDNKTIINYKHYFPEKVEKHDFCNEYEVDISSFEKMEKILNAIGYMNIACVNKVRTKYLLRNEFEIVLDEIKDLGFFIEVEAMKDFGSVKETRDKIFNFINSLPIQNYRIDYRGYPFLVYEQMNKGKIGS